MRLRTYDVSGREVSCAFDGVLPEGDGVVPIDVSSLASGVYLIRLDAGSRHVTTKLDLLR